MSGSILPGLNTGYATSSGGIRAGWPRQHERDILPALQGQWLVGASGVQLTARDVFKQREFEWDMETKPTRREEPQYAVTDFNDLEQQYDSLFHLDNVIRRYARAVEIGNEAEGLKQHHTQNQLLGYYVKRELIGIMWALSFHIYTSEYVKSPLGDPPEQFASFGINEDGTGLRPVASAKWDTDITDSNSRMTYTDANGSPFSYDLLKAAMQTRWSKTGRKDCHAHMDIVNLNILSETDFPNQTVEWSPGKYAREDLVYRFITPVGQVHAHLEGDNYPSRAVWIGEYGKQFAAFGPLRQQGLQKLNIPSTANTRRVMLTGAFGLRITNPNTFAIIYDTAAAA